MIHLDFGAGEIMTDLVGQFTDFDETQWTIIGIDRREPHKDPVFMHIMEQHYDRIGNGWIVKEDNKPPFRFYDMYVVDDIRSPDFVIPKAHSWQCYSTMEHVPEEDVREVMDHARRLLDVGQKTPVLFLDEIHRFSKAQQDALLPGVENGLVVLVAATTKNPSF